MIILQYTKTAVKDLKKLEKKIALRIVKKIKENSEIKNPLTRAKELVGIFENLYRYRIGDYRAIFKVDDRNTVSIISVLNIKHRKDIYKS